MANTEYHIQADDTESKNEGKENQTEGLESNPKHVLEDIAAAKLEKTER